MKELSDYLYVSNDGHYFLDKDCTIQVTAKKEDTISGPAKCVTKLLLTTCIKGEQVQFSYVHRDMRAVHVAYAVSELKAAIIQRLKDRAAEIKNEYQLAAEKLQAETLKRP